MTQYHTNTLSLLHLSLAKSQGLCPAKGSQSKVTAVGSDFAITVSEPSNIIVSATLGES